MDEVPTRMHVEAHVKAVLEGDIDTVTNDFVPDMRDQVQDAAAQLPQPTTNADVEKLDMHEDHAIARIRYSNDEASIALRTRWEEHGGRPMIVEVSEAD